MSWLIITVLSYFIFAAVVLVDKRLLTSSIPDPKIYVFYVGALGMLALLLAPFVGFSLPGNQQIVLGILAGASFILGLFWFYKALCLFEASRVAPAVGGLTPIFTFGLIYFISRDSVSVSLLQIASFLLLVSGSALIVSEKNKFVNLKSLKISAVAAFFISLSFVFTKYLFLDTTFWSGFILKSIGGGMAAMLFFIIFPEIKKGIFVKRTDSSSKTAVIFLANQSAGATASVLQNFAISLAPLAYVAFINALQGVQYVFLLVIAIILSVKFPRVLREEISRGIIVRKAVAVLTIACGLIILLK